jgi:hypothetical protein
VTAAALLGAGFLLALLTISVLLLRRSKRPRSEPSLSFTVDHAAVDSTAAAIAELTAETIGASNPRLVAHPQNDTIHVRRRRRTKKQKDKPSIRTHTGTLDDVPSGNSGGAVAAGKLATPEPEPVSPRYWRTRANKRDTSWFVHVATVTSDPSEAAAAWALAAVTAISGRNPAVHDIINAAADMAALTPDNPYLDTLSDLTRHTVYLGNQPITCATQGTWQYAAAADLACGQGEHARAQQWLSRAPMDDPVFILLRAVESSHVGEPLTADVTERLTPRLSAIAEQYAGQ